MSLKFRKVLRKVLAGPEAGKEYYYATAKSSGSSPLEKICKMISARSTVSSADVKSVFDNLAWAMDLELSSGQVVKLGELGTFRVGIKSDPADNYKACDAHKIKGARLIFTPGKALRETLRNMSYEPDEVKTVEVEVEVETECEKEHVE